MKSPALLFLLLPAALAGAHPLDGERFLITSTRTGDTEIFLIDPPTGDATNLTRSPKSEDRYPCWSPDGQQIAFTSDRDGTMNLYVMKADGSEKRQIVPAANPWGAIFPTWSPDGKRIAYAFKTGDALEIFSGNADGSDLRQVTHLGRISTPPAWSPDGKWISFRETDERYWSDPERMKKIYAEHPGDKRPVWIVHPDGTDAQLVEVTRYGCAMDGSRAQWKPIPSK